MKHKHILTTKEKALYINLDNRIYGTFAEIGAGQDVAGNFFKAGGASGTVAKTMSAYDMSFSDAIYGKGERYVCEERLMRMLEKEFNLLPERLTDREPDTRFFAFANTIEAINFKKTNRGHGWVGLRFQVSPQSPPNDCIIHIELKDQNPVSQQQALGVVGVNLIYGCFEYYKSPEKIINSLLDNIDEGRVEIDMFSLSGPDFDKVDNRLLSLELVSSGLTNAAMFGADGSVIQPSEVLYKKNILVLRGRFRPVTNVAVDMMLTGLRQFLNEPDVKKDSSYVLTELTLKDLNADGSKIDKQDFLNRADLICSLGQNVLISNYYKHFKLVDYLSGFARDKKIGLIIGVHNLKQIFDETYYTDLKGGILESFGSLFGANVKLYVYPAREMMNSDEILTCESFKTHPRLNSLFKYLYDNHKIEGIRGANKEILNIISDDVLEMIRKGQNGWEHLVPYKVHKMIKDKQLFNYNSNASKAVNA
ncbi:MAG: TonB-dependent receptor [Bacteroidota bacterium]